MGYLCIRLTSLPPVNELSVKCGSLNIQKRYGALQSVTRIALPYLYNMLNHIGFHLVPNAAYIKLEETLCNDFRHSY
jgi:hypothetical protein